jgi:hypothetical protein
MPWNRLDFLSPLPPMQLGGRYLLSFDCEICFLSKNNFAMSMNLVYQLHLPVCDVLAETPLFNFSNKLSPPGNPLR